MPRNMRTRERKMLKVTCPAPTLSVRADDMEMRHSMQTRGRCCAHVPALRVPTTRAPLARIPPRKPDAMSHRRPPRTCRQPRTATADCDTADVTNSIRRYAHVNHVEVCECPRIRCECMRISPRICGSSRECARISVNLFANVRVSPANLRGPSANVRECVRMCADPRMCANVRECPAIVRECVRMCANAAVYLRECVANV